MISDKAYIAFAGERHGGLIVDVLLSGGRQETHGNQPEDFLLRFRQCGNVLLFKLHCRDDGIVIRDLRIVCDTPDVGSENAHHCLALVALVGEREEDQLDEDREQQDDDAVVAYELAEEIEDRDNHQSVDPAEDAPSEGDQLGEVEVFVG